jgi:hypothetical protein
MEALLALLVVLIVFIIIYWILNQIPFPASIAQFKWLIYVILLVIAIVYLIERFL